MSLGGGEATLTADLAARAIIAAAQAYGDDPVKALSAKRGIPRRSLPAAVLALEKATGRRRETVCAVLRVEYTGVGRARRRGGAVFEAAVAAALRAARRASQSGAACSATVKPVLRAAPGPAAAKPRVLTPKAVQREVMKVLTLEPSTAPHLMEILELGEAQVRQALRALADEGAVAADAMTAEGWRVQTWRLVA